MCLNAACGALRHRSLLNTSQQETWFVIVCFVGFSCREVISQAERENATFVEGSLVDRLAPSGILRRVLPAPHILQQFPVECLVVENFAGPRERVIAFKVGAPS